jgi:hypothetical protein
MRVLSLLFTGLEACTSSEVAPHAEQASSAATASTTAALATAIASFSAGAAPSSSGAAPSASPSGPSRRQLAVPLAPADQCDAAGALKPGAIRLHGVDAHDAAGFFAELYRANVVAIGEAEDPRGDACPGPCLSVDATAPTLADAARAAGLRASARGPLVLVGPAELPKARSRLPAGALIDFDLRRARSTKVAEILGDILKREVRGMPEGDVTLAVRGVSASEVLALMIDALGGTATVAADGSVTVSGGAATPLSPGAASCPSEGVQAPVALRCVDVADLRVAAVGQSGSGPPIALLTARTKEGVRFISARVRPGAEVGSSFVARRPEGEYAQHAKVVRIDCKGVELDTGARLGWQ